MHTVHAFITGDVYRTNKVFRGSFTAWAVPTNRISAFHGLTFNKSPLFPTPPLYKGLTFHSRDGNKGEFYLFDHVRCLMRFDFFASCCRTPALRLKGFDFFNELFLRSIITPTMYPTTIPTQMAPTNPMKNPLIIGRVD